MQIVWDPKKNRYVNKDEADDDGDDGAKKDLPPPTDTEVQQKLMPPTLPSAASGANVARMTFNRQKVRGMVCFDFRAAVNTHVISNTVTDIRACVHQVSV
jgi:hypothetical protein